MDVANGPAAVRETGPSRGALLGALFGALLLCSGLGCGGDAEETEASAALRAGESAPAYRQMSLPFAEGAQPARSAIGDLDGDGRADFVVCGATPGEGVLRLYLATSEEGYDTRDLTFASAPRDVLVADLDADGDLDLVTANGTAENLTLFLGDGKGAFTPAPWPLQLPYRPLAVGSADLDGDGILDVVGVAEGGQVGIFFGEGRGIFRDRVYLPCPGGASDVAIADVDADGDLDLLVPLSRDRDVAIYPNEGDRTFGPFRKVDAGTRQPFSVAVSDLDRDGALDLITPDTHGDPIRVHPGGGDGTFGEALRLPGAVGARDLSVTDLDADGRPDIVVTASAANRLFLFYGRGDGPFEGEGEGRFASPEPLVAGDAPRSTAVGDLNGDGLPDLVTANRDSHDVTVFLSEPGRRVALQEVRPPTERDPAAIAALAPDYEEVLADFRSGDYEKARPALEVIVAAGRDLYARGALVPDAANPGWVRYHAALLLLSDLHRYHLGDPARARDLERELAEDAERFGHRDLAVVQWLSVGEIEEQSLGDRAAAAAAYERVLEVGRQADGAPRFLLDSARSALDRARAGDADYQRALPKLALPYPAETVTAANEVSAFVFPHLRAYSDSDNPIEANRAFAEAHPGTFRAVFSEYTSVLVSLIFSGRYGSVFEVADTFMERYPHHPLAFAVAGHVMAYYHRTAREQEYQQVLDRARERAKEAGMELEVSFESKDA